MGAPVDPDAITVEALPGTTRPALRRLFLLLVLAMAVMAIVHGARWDGDLQGTESTPTGGIVQDEAIDRTGSYDVIVSIISIVVLLLVLWVLLRQVEPGMLLVAAGIVLALLLLAMMLRIAEPEAGEPIEEVPDEAVVATETVASGASIGLGIAVAVMALLAGVLLYRHRRRRQVAQTPELADELVDIATQVRASADDDRRAVIDAYRRVESSLADAGHARRGHETTAEHLGRVVGRLGRHDTAAAIEELGSIYQDVAFGHTDPRITARLSEHRARVADLFDLVAEALAPAREAAPS